MPETVFLVVVVEDDGSYISEVVERVCRSHAGAEGYILDARARDQQLLTAFNRRGELREQWEAEHPTTFTEPSPMTRRWRAALRVEESSPDIRALRTSEQEALRDWLRRKRAHNDERAREREAWLHKVWDQPVKLDAIPDHVNSTCPTYEIRAMYIIA